MKVNSYKSVKTKGIALTNDTKEIVLAKISTKQAIIVAIISLLSTVAVTAIANLDKIRNTKNVISEEIGYYEGRASIVEQAFREREEEIQSQSELAQQMGKTKTANHLKELSNEVRRNHVKFQELHTKHLDAVQNDNRLSASKIKTETNEAIRELDHKLLEGVDVWLPTKDEAIGFGRRPVKLTVLSYGGRRTFDPIPLYGKQPKNIQEQVCKLRTPIK